MKKFVIATLLIIALTMTNIYAEDIQVTFDLDSLENEVSEDHTKIELKRMSLEVQNNKLEEAKKQASQNNFPGGSAVGYINRQIIVKSNPLIAEMNVELAERAITDQERNLKYDVKTYGMDLILLNLEKEYNEKLKTYKEAKVGFKEARVNAGMETAATLNGLRLDLESHILSMNDINFKIQSKTMDLNYLLERPLTSNIEINDTIKIAPFDTFTIDNILENNIEQDDSYYTKKVTYDSKVINYEIYKKQYDELQKQEAKNLDPKRPEEEVKEEERILDYKKEITDGLVKAKLDMNISELELRDAERTFEINLRTTHNSYVQAYDSYQVALMERDLAITKLNEAKIKLDLGNINNETYMLAEESLTTKDFNLTKAIYNFNKAKIALEKLL